MEKSDQQNQALVREIDKFIEIVRKDHIKLSAGIEQIMNIIKKHSLNAFRSTKMSQLSNVADTYFSLGHLIDKLIALYTSLT